MITPSVLLAASAMTFAADRIAADNITHAVTATGHVVATSAPMTIRGELMTRGADGTMTFHHPCCATTCTNDVGHTHWNVSGEVEYREKDCVILRDVWLRFWEVPVFWLPYLYYPLETDCGFSWMPGYTGRWGAFLLTRYAYPLAGDPARGEDAFWLTGATRFDLRYRQGIALGEDLEWSLGRFGRGSADFYYAWDNDAEEHYGADNSSYSDSYHSLNWESPVKRDRYSAAIRHRWEATERDTVRLRASVLSDSSFRDDFDRQTLLNWRGQWYGYENSGLFWEHLENVFSFGAEVSGRLNEFYGMTDRLPEIYLDVNPQPLFGWPINYESENRLGYLRRNPAEFGRGDPTSAYSFVPGRWASYEALRFDTYHRLSAPFRAFDDILAVVPRVGYHGTFWSQSGEDELTGWGVAENAGELFRSILEGGVTFAARGSAWVDETWRHAVEPYFDVLAQKAWLSGGGNRPYVFDAVDASTMWEDQFAGRSRNLPYSYYGVTPGFRNGWSAEDAHGRLREVLDLDAYAALQFGTSSYTAGDDAHRLADPGEPNYGKHGCVVVPGARMRLKPDEDASLLVRAEYDSDDNRIAMADVGWRQKLSERFKFDVDYQLRDYRSWDFSSSPFDPQRMAEDVFNYARFHYARVGFENQPLDWFAWGPFVRWDIRENELDRVGSWFDYLTDCLGFRLIVEYRNSYTRVDGYERGEDWSVGFYIYLRAFGAESGNFFGN